MGSEPDQGLAENLIQRVNVGDSLARSAAAHPARTAVVDGDRRWTYAEFNRWVNRVAHGLADRGYRRGDALAIASGNSAEFLAVYYAAAKLGVVCVPINLGWRGEEVTYVLEHSRSKAVVVESQLVDALSDAIAGAGDVAEVIVAPGTGADHRREPADRGWCGFGELEGDVDTEPDRFVADRDPLSYLYTSGTTSFPKGVMTGHLAIYLESMSSALECGWSREDRFAAMMPMFHTAQLNAFCTPAVLVGASIHVQRGFDPRVLLDTIEGERITQVFGLPMMYRTMLEHPSFAGRDLSSLRRCTYAMAAMPEALIRRCLDEFGCDFALLFGQTEMSPVTTLFRPEHQLSHLGAVGTPVTNVAVAIMGPDGELLPTGEQGEIVYRGPSTMTGYLRNEQATEEAFAHGWFHSGDVGRFDSDGVLWFADRFKDVIKTGGENVASIEVELAVYAADPRIGEVVVVGLPHARWTEAITAVVLPKDGETVDPDELIGTLKQTLDGYKVPKSVIVVSELPRTSTGKVQKNVVRARHDQHYID
ncbi:AMP-binding protein [Pseudonocardia spinosispora]|uniref:AMP-binding protein n=1 Tax=Pseudonocardia spinosispora TaxID=103441 RepID=UPI00042A8DC1|nr:AMP-binding protein [Pseudonocardia spinosispora]